MNYSLKKIIYPVSIMLFISISASSFQVKAETPKPPTGGAYTPFEQALVYVYQQNPQINADRDQLKVLDERVSQAISGYRPSLAANVGTGEQRESVNGQAWRYGDDTNASLILTQPLFTFGTLAQRRAADARVEAGRAHLLATEQTVFFAAITDWLDLCAKEKIAILNQENVQRMGQYREATQQRAALGEGTSTEQAQAESRMSEAEARFAMANADHEAARAVYIRDVGLEPPNTINFPPLPVDMPQSREETMELARKNPELIEARHMEDAAEHDIDTASSSMWPSIYLRGSMGEERSPVLGLDRQRDDSITINVSLPLYQGGAEYSRVREARIVRTRTQQESITTQRGVMERASQSWSNYYAARSVITSSQRASDAATQMLGGMEEEQRRGTRTLTEVLDARSELLNTQITEAQAQRNIRVEAYRLMAAAGRLTPVALGLKVPVYDPKIHYDETTPKWFGTD